MIINVSVCAMINSLDVYGHLLSTKWALEILTLLHHKPQRRMVISKMVVGTSERGRASSRCNYYLKRLLKIGLVEKQRSVHTTEYIVGCYAITEQGEKIYQMALKCGAEINLLDSKKNLTSKVMIK